MYITYYFISIPKTEDTKQKWLAVIGKDYNKSLKICSDHFKTSQLNFKWNKQNQLQISVKNGAVPSKEKFYHDETVFNTRCKIFDLK